MPAASRYLPDDKEQRKIADDELKARRDMHDKHVRYYRGNHPPSLTPKPGEYDPNVIDNIVRRAVKTTVAFVAPEFPEIDIDLGELVPGEESNETAQEVQLDDYLTQTWMANGGIDLLINALTMGAIDGHHFWRVWQDKRGRVRITLVDGGNTIVWWDAHNRHRSLWYEQHWQAGGWHYRHDIIPNTALLETDNPFDEEMEPSFWIVRQYKTKASPAGNIPHISNWELDEEFQTESALSPIVDQPYIPDPWQFYGEDEVGQLIHLNNAVNKVTTDINQILRFHSSPRTIGIGVSAQEIKDSSIDNFWTVENPDASIFNLEMQSDLAASMNYVQSLADRALQTSQTVILPSDPRVLGNTTNLAVRMLFGPMIAKSNQLHRTYGKAIQEVSARVLDLGGYQAVEPEVIWLDATPVSRLEEVQTLAVEMSQGLTSTETAQRELGRDPLEERRRMRTERLIERQMFAGQTVDNQMVA